EPLDVAGVAGYISHRLHRAGGSADRVTFTGDAVEAIFDLSGGVPRIINKLCDRALHIGHTRKVSTIDAEIVSSANSHGVAPPPPDRVTARGSTVDPPAPPPSPAPPPAAPATAGPAVAIAGPAPAPPAPGPPLTAPPVAARQAAGSAGTPMAAPVQDVDVAT